MLCAEAVAQMRAPQDEFATRYYRWCLKQIEREIEHDFPLVRRIPWTGAFLFLDFATESTREDIRKLMTEGIKRFNPRGAELAGDPITEDEAAIRRRFLAYLYPVVLRHGQSTTSVRTSPREISIRDAEYQGQTTTSFSKKILKLQLQQCLEPILGKPDRSRGGLQYCLPVKPWYLISSLDMSGQKQLYYSQWIAARRKIDFCPTSLRPSITPLSWLGIHSDTGFNLIQEHEVKQAAELIAELCSHVLKHTPDFLSGLTHEIPEDVDDSSHSPLARMRKH